MAFSSVEGEDGWGIILNPIIEKSVSDYKESHPYTNLSTPDRDLLYAAIGQLVIGKLLSYPFYDRDNGYLKMGKILVKYAVESRFINEEEGQKLLELGSGTPQSFEE